MKRNMLGVFLIVLTILLSSCSKNTFVPQQNINYNYNNLNTTANFWLTNEAVYYASSPFYMLYYYEQSAKGTKKIMDSDSAHYANIQEYDGILYMYDDTTEAKFRFHSYDLQTKEHKILVNLKGFGKYFVLQDHVYFMTCPNSLESAIQFDVFSLQTQQMETVCTSIVAAGVVEDKPTYITNAGTQYTIYTYDPTIQESKMIGAFSYDTTDCSVVYNFTSDYIVLALSDDEDSKVLTYNLHSGETVEHTLSGFISTYIAYEDHAFFISLTDKENSDLCRMNLLKGTVEKIDEIQNGSELFVTSDEDVYVDTYLMQENCDEIYHYNINGTKELAFTFKR